MTGPIYGDVPRYGQPQPPIDPAASYSPVPAAPPASEHSGWTQAGSSPPPPWAPPPYATWLPRVAAWLIDFAPSLVAAAVFNVGYTLWLVAAARSDGSALPRAGVGWMIVGGVLLLAATAWQIYNRWILGGRTGQSWGKRLLKITLLSEETWQPIGALNAFARDLVHIVDGFFYLGYLWPLWDAKRQTFADKLMRTVVLRTTDPQFATSRTAGSDHR